MDFQISLPPIPQFVNKSFNFIFSIWIFKFQYRQYHSLKKKLKFLFSFWIFKFHYRQYHDQNIQLENWNFNSKALKAFSFNVFTFSNFEKKAFYTLKSLKNCKKSSSQIINLYIKFALKKKAFVTGSKKCLISGVWCKNVFFMCNSPV